MVADKCWTVKVHLENEWCKESKIVKTEANLCIPTTTSTLWLCLSLGHSGKLCKQHREYIDLQGQGAFWTLSKSNRNIHSNILYFLRNPATFSLVVKLLHRKQCRCGFLCSFGSTLDMKAWMFSPAQLFLFHRVCHNSLLLKKWNCLWHFQAILSCAALKNDTKVERACIFSPVHVSW